MTKRLPAARKLATKISQAKLGKGTLADSIAFLLQKRAELAKYSGVVAFATESDGDAQVKGCEYHLTQIRAQLARELWSRQLFIGVSVLDELLFGAVAHDPTTDPVRRVLEIIRDEGLHYPGFVIFPVHSFGILGAGFLHWATAGRVEYVSSAFGIALSPQTNSLEKTVEFLERARVALGVSKRVAPSSIAHWYRSRSAYWLTRNPLLVVRVRSFPGGYYENQSLLLRTLRASTAILSMLVSLQREQDPDASFDARLWSSSIVNNMQTLDIGHYIVLFNAPSQRRFLGGDCVPMRVRTPALAEISDLNIELDPRFWTRRSVLATRIYNAVTTIHSSHVRHSFSKGKNEVLGRFFRKMFEALAYFRRSFRATEDDWQGIVSLAIAFEMVLTDAYAPNVNARVVRRAKLALKGVRGVRRLRRGSRQTVQGTRGRCALGHHSTRCGSEEGAGSVRARIRRDRRALKVAVGDVHCTRQGSYWRPNRVGIGRSRSPRSEHAASVIPLCWRVVRIRV